jgi:4-nitrophenyl phosphatase
LPELGEALQGIKGLILDMDGVLYLGNRPIKGADRAVKFLRESGKKIIFLTNNSEISRLAYRRKLRRMGIAAGEEEIVTSGQVAAQYIRGKNPKAKIFAIGGPGLFWEIRRAKLRLVSPEKATHLLVGIDRKINYNKIWAGQRALSSGAEFIATNINSTYPTEKGLMPGAGSIVGALVGATKKRPKVVIGKPSEIIIKFGLRVLGTGPKETAIVGDRIDTDVRVGKKVGLKTVLVLSGVSRREDLERVRGTRLEPDIVIDSLAEVVK